MEKIMELIKTVLGIFLPKEEPQNVDLKEDLKDQPGKIQKKKLQEVTPEVKNEDPRLKAEIAQLKIENPELHQLLMALSQWVNVKLNKQVVVTMIFRTQAEQDFLYRNSDKYKQRKFKSPHQFWHAIDLRSWIYSYKERKQMVSWLNENYNHRNYYPWTAKVHEVGDNGLHFHIQLVKKS